eukprot:781629-Amphidinium_carterae.1
MMVCWQRANLNGRFQKVLVDLFRSKAFVMPLYDGVQGVLSCWCPRAEAAATAKACSDAVDSALQKELEWERM